MSRAWLRLFRTVSVAAVLRWRGAAWIVAGCVLPVAWPALAQLDGRGAAAVPFDPARATQTVSITGSGGALAIVSEDGDPGQVALIREFLRDRGRAFAAGDIPAPAFFPDEALPDLAGLRAGAARVAVVFEDVPGGGRLSFTARDPALALALSRWLAASARAAGGVLRVGVPPEGWVIQWKQ